MARKKVPWVTEKEIGDEVLKQLKNESLFLSEADFQNTTWYREYPLSGGYADFLGITKNCPADPGPALTIHVVELKITAEINSIAQISNYMRIVECGCFDFSVRSDEITPQIKIVGHVLARYFDDSFFDTARTANLNLVRVKVENPGSVISFEDIDHDLFEYPASDRLFADIKAHLGGQNG